MTRDIYAVREVLSAYAQGLSLDEIRKLSGVPKTSVKRIIDRALATGMEIEAILELSDEAATQLLMPSRRTRMLYVEPDWE